MEGYFVAATILATHLFDEQTPEFSLFERSFYSAQLPMAVVGMDLKPIYVNNSMEDFLGYGEQELQMMTFPEFTHKEDVDIDVHLFQEILEEKRDHYQIEKRWFNKRMVIRWGRMTCNAIRKFNDKDRELIAVLAVVEPITREEFAMNEPIDSNTTDQYEPNIMLRTGKWLSQVKKPYTIVGALTILLIVYSIFFGDLGKEILEAVVEVVLERNKANSP